MQPVATTHDGGDLSRRQVAILTALLQAYWSGGVPVSSRSLTVANEEGLSSASIRSVLGELEADGYLHQPHTSAGRVPTARAVRWWLQQPEAAAAKASLEQIEALERALQGAGDDAAMAQRACEYLSNWSGQAGVVGVRPWRDAGLKHLRFLRLADQRVLAILVTRDGQVRERVARVPELYTQSELDAAARFFEQQFAGSTLDAIRRELCHRLEEERAAYDVLFRRAVVLSHCGLLAMQDEGQLFVQGASRLAGQLAAERLAELLDQLQQRERWLQLLTDIAADTVAWNGAGDAPVCVRLQLEQEQLPELALVSIHCGRTALGVLGPTGMEFPRVLGAIASVGALYARMSGSPTT